MGHLVVVGSVNADVYVEIKQLPLPGETLEGRGGFVLPGGKGANQAVAASRLAGQTKLFFGGSFGNDGHSDMLKTELKGYNVDVSTSSKADVPSGQAYILLQEGGQNSIIIIGGSNQSWPCDLQRNLTKAIESSSGVLLQREIPDVINLKVAKLASSLGIPVYMDVGGADTDLPPSIFPYLFLLAPNETELSRISGLPTETLEQTITAAKKIQRQGVKNVLVTLGTRGSLYIDSAQKVYKKTSFKVDKVVDTTGAGDCYRAAFAVYLTEHGHSQVGHAMSFAAAAAALCVQRKGAMPSMPSRTEVETYLRASSVNSKL